MRRRLAMLVFTGAFTGALALAGAGALAQAEAERQLDAALERLRLAFGPEARLAVGQRQVDPVTGRARLGELTITAPTERITVTELLLQDLTGTRLGRAEARSILLVTNIGTAEDRFEVARLVLGGMSLPAAGQEFSLSTFELGTMELEALRGTGQPGLLTVGRASLEGYGPGVLGAASLEGVDFRDSGSGALAFRLGRAAVQSMVLPPLDGSMPDPRQFSVQLLTLEGAELREPDNQVDLAIGRFALRDWVPGRLTDLAVEGVRVAAPFGALGAGDVRIGRIASQGIDMAGTTIALMDGVQVPDPVVGTPQSVVMEGLTAQAGGQPVFALGRTAIEASMDASGLAETSMGLQGLRVTLPAGTVAWLEQHGYREIAGGMELRGSARREGGVLDIAPFGLRWSEAASLALRTNLSGMPLPRPGEEQDDDAIMAQLMRARLHGLTLSLRDEGLMGRVLAEQARSQGVPEAQLREQFAQMALAMPIPGAGPAAPPSRAAPAPAPARKGAAPAAPPASSSKGPAGSSKGAAPQATAPQTSAPQTSAPRAAGPADPFLSVREALASFIRQPGELEFTLRPAQPVSFEDMQGLAAAGPVETARRLGLSAVAR
ncbi:hypothetical protein [Falsiroseomonas sp.]|uniref:hypothetical protein n=1 Tax=Falsiroseomonas sp. TaxID=2870721 RepID=UPI002736AE3F|nr:hypothetical protein [Falsiroseomonas sp.]MDP3417434.1 hypothetical protein [Falsiroseomonas sp.]